MHTAGPSLEFESEAPPFSGPSPELYGLVEMRHDGKWIIKGLEGEVYDSEEEALDKGRGEPCKQGERASSSGCIPRNKPKPREPSGGSAEDLAAKLQALFDKGGLSFEEAVGIKDDLMKMNVADIKKVRDKLGLEATGKKQELADKISQLAMWKEGPSPFGGKYGRGSDGTGRGGSGEGDAADGAGLARETGRAGDEAAGGAGADDSESASAQSAADLSAAKDRVIKRVERYKEVMLKKGMKDQAEWMTELAKHVEELGIGGALEALGEEKATRGPGDKIQYVGAYEDLVGGVDKDSQFVKKYLENSGIVLAGATIDPNLSVISSWSKRNIAAQGMAEIPEAPGDYVPSDQTFTNKLEESQALPGLESSEDIHKVFGSKVSNFTPAVVAKLNEKYGKGSWIVKSYGEEAYAGFGIFFPQRVKQINSDAKALMADAKSWLNDSGYRVAKGEGGKIIGVKKGGKTYAVGTPEYGKLPKKMQRYGKQAIQASHAINGAALPSSPLDSLQNDYGISFLRDKDGLPIGITNYDGKDYNFDDPKIKEIEDLDGGATGYAIHRAQEADEWRRGGYKNEPKFMVQPAFKAVGVSDYDRAMGNTWETAKEGRVHVVTRNGKASAVPYATLVGRGDDLPAVFQSEDSKAMEKAVEEAIDQLPESERAGQMYAPDVMKTKDGWKVIELNPSAEGGGSDWLGRNPFVIDAVVSHLTNREPKHVAFVRKMLTDQGVKTSAKIDTVLPVVGPSKGKDKFTPTKQNDGFAAAVEGKAPTVDVNEFKFGKNIGATEHKVYFNQENNRYYKIPHEHEGEKYLERHQILNQVWPELGYKMEGVGKDGTPVVSMNAFVGTKPTGDELKGYLKDNGWKASGESHGDTYHNDKLGVTIADVMNPGNWIKTGDGKLVPIDVDARREGGKHLKGWFKVKSDGTLRYVRKPSFMVWKGRGEPCKQGESAARSGCIPATDSGGRRPAGKETGGQYASTGEIGSVYSVKVGNVSSKYSLHTNKRIDGPSLPLKNYKQQDDHSCGFVAALTLARYLAPDVSAKDVLKAVRPTKSGGIDGESLAGALKEIGVGTKFSKDLTIGKLRKAVEKGIPVLLTVYPEDWTSDHWTTVQGFDDDRIYLTNYKSLPIAQFKREWFDQGEGMLCYKLGEGKP